MPAADNNKVGFGRLFKNHTFADILSLLQQSDNRAVSWFNFCARVYHTWVPPHPFLEVWRYIADRHPVDPLRQADNTYEAGTYEYTSAEEEEQQDSDDEILQQLASLTQSLTELTLKIASKKSKK